MVLSAEIDGDATDESVDLPDDWQSIGAGTSSAPVTSGIISDGSNPPVDGTYFTGGGSKDINDITEWAHTSSDQAPDKDELTNVYAAIYVREGEQLFYFGADRYASKGDSQIGFWLFKEPVDVNPDGTFEGAHTEGDLLILSDFVKGGKILNVKVYKDRKYR